MLGQVPASVTIGLAACAASTTSVTAWYQQTVVTATAAAAATATTAAAKSCSGDPPASPQAVASPHRAPCITLPNAAVGGKYLQDLLRRFRCARQAMCPPPTFKLDLGPGRHTGVMQEKQQFSIRRPAVMLPHGVFAVSCAGVAVCLER